MRLPHWLLLPVLIYLAGCGGPEVKEEPPPPPPTRIELNIKAGADINPDATDRASPLLFRVYELKDLANFNGADFFALYGKEQETLGSDLVKKQEFTLVPKDTRKLEFEADPATKHLAVFAAFRNLETAQWRASADIPREQTTIVDVEVKNTQITLQATPKTPEPNPSEPENAGDDSKK